MMVRRGSPRIAGVVKAGFEFSRAVPLGVRRRGSDELFGCPFSPRRRSERPSPGASCQSMPKAFEADAYRFVYSQEPLTKSKKHFPLELCAKTGWTPLSERHVARR